MSTVLESLDVPIVQAPMGGGLSTVQLATAVSKAGGLGFLAAGYRTASQLEADIRDLCSHSPGPFGVNVFVPGSTAADPEVYASYLSELRPVAESYGSALGEPRFDDDDWDAKLALLQRIGAPVVSFVFACPPPDVVQALKAAGSEVWITVTDLAEARAAVAAGADVLVAQGYEAGAHRGAFDDQATAEPLGLLALLQLLVTELEVPIVAAGGISTGAGLAAVLAAGAAAAQIGTAFLLSPEAGTSPPHRAAIAGSTPTRLTRAFTGRRARAIENDFVRRFSAGAPSAYPEIHYATAPLRAAAREAGDEQTLHLWAGQTHQLARALPAAEIVERLGAEAAAALEAARRRAVAPRRDVPMSQQRRSPPL